jgi:FkbM family methyltransferase
MSEPPDWRLKGRRRVRSFPPVRSVSVIRQVLSHPSNQGARWAAVKRALLWQLRSRTRSAPLDLVVYGGLTLRAHPRSNSASNVIYFTPYYDPDEMAFLNRFLKAGDTFVDGGANIGTYTLLAANLVGPSGRVVSFEPSTQAARHLRENVAINGLEGIVLVRQAAIGAERGFVKITSGSDVSNSIVSAAEAGRLTEVIEVVPLDGTELPFRPSVIKLDVEGYEMEALRGMHEMLVEGRRPILIIEFTPHLLRRAGTSATDVAAHLDSLGYSLYKYSHAKNEFVSVDHGMIENMQANYLGMPNERMAEIMSNF